MPKKKKPTKTYYKDKADKAFSLMIRQRDGVCVANRARTEKCESPRYLQCAHIHSRSYSATRLDPENAVTLCRSCHRYFTDRPLEWAEFIGEILGENYYNRLGIRALAGARRSHAIDWEEVAREWVYREKSGTRLPTLNWTQELGAL